MIALFGFSVLGWLQLGGRLLQALPCEGWGVVWKRLPLFIIVWLLLGLLTGIHWVGFLFDEILFFGYRRVRPEKPVFILGIPRSGTTFLQRVLAADASFTTLKTWECLLAPSISERFVLTGFGRILKPLSAIGQAMQQKLLRRMDAIHTIRMGEPEEDFLLFLFVQACFLLVVPCPNVPFYWKLGQFDKALRPSYRRRVMHFYYRCLQKHLYYHGVEKRILSKNPSFTPLMKSLRQTFPDAKFIACVRSPLETIPSQLSSLQPAFELVGTGRLRQEFVNRMISLLHHYYDYISEMERDDNVWIVEMHRLNLSLLNTIAQLYEFIEHSISEDFRHCLHGFAERARHYKSNHQYQLSEFSLSSRWVEKRFSDVWPVTAKQHLEAF
jgi:hypothetical protein